MVGLHESRAQALEREGAAYRAVIRHAHRGLAKVIRQQNGLLPINRLPPDLVVPILALSLDATAESHHTGQRM